MPTLYIIAGPNGVGKTTFADEYLVIRDRADFEHLQREAEFEI